MAPSAWICSSRLLILFLLWSHEARASPHALNNWASMVKRHEVWMAQHGIVYENDIEKAKRFLIFSANVEEIERLNKLNRGFTLGANAFTDLTNEEFQAIYTGCKGQSSAFQSKSRLFKYENVTQVPNSIDWRTLGAVTPIKHQGRCRSCWAFSTVAATEGLHKIKTGELISLSVQEVLDCSDSRSGCHGGYLKTAFIYIEHHGGLAAEAKYPYTANVNECNTARAALKVASIKGYEGVPVDEMALMNAVAHHPVSALVAGSSHDFKQYSSGVFAGKCASQLNHAVTIVGYGVVASGDQEETRYWIIKNSWGTRWGEEGYMRMKIGAGGKQGLCGIARQASYPIA